MALSLKGDKCVVMFVLLFSSFLICACYAEENNGAADKWKKKHITDYNDADMERLYEQWEDADEDPLEEDELPEWKKPQPKIDLSKLNPDDPESMLKMTKQGRTLMMFATISGDPTEKETEQITQLWQTSLFNAHYDVQRYVVGSNRVLFVLKDGGTAWEIKDFLITQDRCEVVTIEGKDYPGKASKEYKGSTAKPAKKSSSKKAKTKDDDHTDWKKVKVTDGNKREEL